MQNNLMLQAEYADIILALLGSPYDIDSVVKLVFIAFCVKEETSASYGRRENNLVDALLNNLDIKLISHPDELKAIFEVLSKLKKCGWIATENGRIRKLRELPDCECNNEFLSKYRKKPDNNPVNEVNKLDDKAFVEEVLRHV